MSGRRPTWRSLAALLAAIVATSAPRARAGPTVIRDEMLRDTTVTPTLGRGYSIATNTYQSICLKDIVKTKPSYNFNYLFQEVQEDGTLAKSNSTSASVATFFLFTTGVSFGGGTVDTSTRYDESTQTAWHKHSLLVTILIDVYYSSVDESGSKLSPSALDLLINKDVPGFFDACGLYYVRSITRQAALLSTFTYETKSSKRDTAFELSLRFAVAQFGVTGGGIGASASTGSVDQSNTMSASFSASNLTIRTIAMGLGKDESVMLVSYDLDTFKNAVKGAFKATQAEDVGMVTAIELSPWVENTEFQANNKLEPLTVPVRDATGKPEFEPQLDPNVPPKPKLKVVTPYAQKRILTQNSEFLSEADRAGRTKLNVYYKAKSCKSRIEADMMLQIRPGFWTWRITPTASNVDANTGDTFIVNNKSGQDQQPLSWLYALLGPRQIQLIFDEYDAFTYGGSGPDVPEAEKSPIIRAKIALDYMTGVKKPPYPRNVFPGSTRCLDDLLTAGLTAVSYRSIPSCERLEELFVSVSGGNVDSYCLPSYGPPPKKAGFEGGSSAGMDKAAAEAARTPRERWELEQKENERLAAEKDAKDGLSVFQRERNAKAREQTRESERKERAKTDSF